MRKLKRGTRASGKCCAKASKASRWLRPRRLVVVQVISAIALLLRALPLASLAWLAIFPVCGMAWPSGRGGMRWWSRLTVSHRPAPAGRSCEITFTQQQQRQQQQQQQKQQQQQQQHVC